MLTLTFLFFYVLFYFCGYFYSSSPEKREMKGLPLFIRVAASRKTSHFLYLSKENLHYHFRRRSKTRLRKVTLFSNRFFMSNAGCCVCAPLRKKAKERWRSYRFSVPSKNLSNFPPYTVPVVNPI